MKEFNEKLENSNFYKTLARHKKVITIVEGLIIIGLLISINTYFLKDFSVKQQIKERCGYTTSTYECVCEKNFVDNWKELRRGNYNLTVEVENVSMDR